MGLSWYRKLQYSNVPRYDFACSREVVSSYCRNSVLKKRGRWIRFQLIASSDVDEEAEDFVDTMALRLNGIMEFISTISSCLKMETNLAVIIGERMMITEAAVSRRQCLRFCGPDEEERWIPYLDRVEMKCNGQSQIMGESESQTRKLGGCDDVTGRSQTTTQSKMIACLP
jgi:hypothetical protein